MEGHYFRTGKLYRDRVCVRPIEHHYEDEGKPTQIKYGCPMYKESNGNILVEKSKTFDLKQISQSGQCFRLKQISENEFIAITQNHYVVISITGKGYEFNCSMVDFERVWFPYFDLETDYICYQNEMVKDNFLKSAIEFGGGIRILRQDLWEMIVTFIISQRNNIPRIQKSVEALCKAYGTHLVTICGEDIYSFPTLSQLREKDLSVASLGYREKYIKELCEIRESDLLQIKNQDDETAKKSLLQIKGVGGKVASCILLFGLHRMNSYPIDVWVKRLIEDIYDGDFNPNLYSGYAGYVQQLQFYYYRSINKV